MSSHAHPTDPAPNTPTFTLEAMQFFGRLGREYEQMFARPLSSLVGLQVLDCPSGPSSGVAAHSRLSCASRIRWFVAPSVPAPVSGSRTIVKPFASCSRL